jgi:NAD(P)-dependent dehydrogenase (short-subunit alcohol dehydrogenase family)
VDAGLKGKAALITGGSSGIGLGIARALAEEGVDLAVASRHPDPRALDELRQLGVRVVEIPADVSQETEVSQMVQTAVSSLGKIDLYINNAAWAWHQPITRIDSKSWLNTIHTNLSACVWACREIAPHMIERRSGGILIVGSTAMLTPLYRETAYRISKTGLKVTMEILALELAPYGIRVNMIVPGHFVTRLTADFTGKPLETLKQQIPLRRTGEPAEIGPAAVLLLSDKLSSYITGTYLIVDGGLHLRPLPIFGDDEILTMNIPSPVSKPG